MNIRDGIWFIDLEGRMELEKRFRIHVGTDGEKHLTAEDGNTYLMGEELWMELKGGASRLDEGESQKANRYLLKMLKCKLYIELSMMEDAGTLTPSERVLINTLFNDI